jgi:hypothetical protein
MHLRNFDMDLADRVHAEYHKYDKILRAAVNMFVKSVSPPKDSTVPPEVSCSQPLNPLLGKRIAKHRIIRQRNLEVTCP